MNPENRDRFGRYIPPHERDPYVVANHCQRIGSSGAQSVVFLLPPEYGYDVQVGDEAYEESAEVYRLMKIAKSYRQTLQATYNFDIPSEDDREKIAWELTLKAKTIQLQSMWLASMYEDVQRVLGNPQLVESRDGVSFRVNHDHYANAYGGYFEAINEDSFHTAYTQDYVLPASEVISSPNTSLESACRLVDDYVDTQLLLARYGLFDTTFKLADNCGVYPHEGVYASESDRFRLFDFGELTMDLEEAVECIADEKWAQVVRQPEVTQLPPEVQEYMNAACKARLTEEAVRKAWNSSLKSPDASFMPLQDTSVPPHLASTLWKLEKYEQQVKMSLLRGYKTPELLARACTPIGKKSAQSMVFLLPEEYNYDVSSTGELEDATEVSRVVKVFHSVPQAYESTQEFAIGEDERPDKARKLVADNYELLEEVMIRCQYDEVLEVMLGNPLPLRSLVIRNGDTGDMPIDFATPPPGDYPLMDVHWFGSGYTQELAVPFSEVFSKLDTENNEEDFKEACRMIDLYVEGQLYMARHGLFDTIYKLADNCGRFKEKDFFSEGLLNFRFFDFGELSTSLDEALESLAQKRWREVSSKPEYTPLPPSVQEYLNAVCEARLTPEALRSVWEVDLNPELGDKSLSGGPRSFSGYYETTIPPELPELLWHKYSMLRRAY